MFKFLIFCIERGSLECFLTKKNGIRTLGVNVEVGMTLESWQGLTIFMLYLVCQVSLLLFFS